MTIWRRADESLLWPRPGPPAGIGTTMPIPLSQVVSVTLYPLCIPLRFRVAHAAAERAEADPIVVRIELASGTVGYGETLVREYVTGETPATVFRAMADTIVPALVDYRPRTPASAPMAIRSVGRVAKRRGCRTGL